LFTLPPRGLPTSSPAHLWKPDGHRTVSTCPGTSPQSQTFSFCFYGVFRGWGRGLEIGASAGFFFCFVLHSCRDSTCRGVKADAGASKQTLTSITSTLAPFTSTTNPSPPPPSECSISCQLPALVVPEASQISQSLVLTSFNTFIITWELSLLPAEVDH
uniref:Uncharacterized protein n=1 Tax=Gasterosteus aculeatus TaxID=69293 RepID=G3Q8T5_GASAC